MREEFAFVLSVFITLLSMVVGGNIYLAIKKAMSKRPHKSDDEEDNPITKFKDDLANIYENNPKRQLKKLAQAVWNRVEEIEKWHYEEIHDWERKYYSARYSVGELDVKCDGYREELDEWTKRCEELQSKLNESQERLKRESAKVKTLESETDKLRDMLKEEQETNKIPIFSDQTEVPAYLLGENTFGGQINPFAKITLNKEPMTATEATELAERLQMLTSQPIVMDSETLNEPPINNEEFIKKLRDWWGLEASKAVEIATPDADKKEERYVTADELRMEYARVLLYARPKDVPIKHYRVRVVGTYNNGRDMLHTDWSLPATSINEIIDVLGKDGLHIIGGEELPI